MRLKSIHDIFYQPGDSLSTSNGFVFATHDKPGNNYCYAGNWWNDYCQNMNGLYGSSGDRGNNFMTWTS